MKNPFSNPLLLRLIVVTSLCLAAFFTGKHYFNSSSSNPLSFYNFSSPSPSHFVSVSPNVNFTFNISSLINNGSIKPSPAPVSSLLPPPPPPAGPFRVGILDEDGVMRDDFDPGTTMDSDLEEGNNSTEVEDSVSTGTGENSNEGSEGIVRLERFKVCGEEMSEYIPCLDNEEAIKKLESTERRERFERHCPDQEFKKLNCLIPVPKGYKTPIPWPKSRDEVWFNNVPHTRLVEDKGGQNWITKVKDKFQFPGGGTQFIHGADQYINQISQMVPEISFGTKTRTVLDIGCGVASFGAYLISKNVITMSIAPKDVHENQIQFALERGVPAFVGAFTSKRLLFPSLAFDLIHCSRCRINWTRDDGILLLEVNRMLRAGGYFTWAAQPVYKHEETQIQAWKEMEDLTRRICWELVKKEGYIAIWKKPLNNSCYLNRVINQPPLCDDSDDPNNVWYIKLKPCITKLVQNESELNIPLWPERLYKAPKRLEDVEMDAYSAKIELFTAESRFWNEIVENFIRVFKWRKVKRFRNVMDMRAGFGGFGAALIDKKMDVWVMNVVPISGPNTLPVIYDRGLIGVAHDWCEPFDTYPRTYDFLHASGLFSVEKKRCNITNILLEMDRILRPGGKAYIRDNKSVIYQIKEILSAMGWRVELRDTSEGPYAMRKVLRCEKILPRS